MVPVKAAFCRHICFYLYMHRIAGNVSSSGIGCHLGGIPVNILLYADDIAIIAPSWFALQNLIDLCAHDVTCLDMKFNATKSVSIVFTPVKPSKRVHYNFPKFVLDGVNIEFVENFKYLGHMISSSSNDDTDIRRQMSLLYARTNVLIRKFSRCSRNVKLCLFKAHCISFYELALWKVFHVSVMNKLQAAYVKCIKMFFDYNRTDSVTAMFFELGLSTFNTLLHNARAKLQSCISHH